MRRQFLTLLCLLLAGAHAIAGGRFDDIIARGVLRVGTTGDYKPFSARIGKAFVGLDIDLAVALAQAMGVRLQFVPTSWPTLMEDFGADAFDVALGGVSVTAERQRQALFSLPYLRDGKTPIARCEHQARYATLAQIDQPGVRLIVNPGGTNERYARVHAPHAQLIVYPDNVTIFAQLAAGAADVMMTDAIEARLQQRLHPSLCAVHPEVPFDVSEKAILLPCDPEFKAYVDQWLQARGDVQKDLERWLDFPWALQPLRQAIDQRLQLAPAVARAKWNVQAALEDLPREAQVIAAAVKQGAALGLPAAAVERVFRAQIEASKTVQRELFIQWRAGHVGKFDHAIDLAKTVRPELDHLSTQILLSMAANQRVLIDPARKADVVRALGGLDAAADYPTAATQALAPFIQGM